MTLPVQLATQVIPQADVLWDVIQVPVAVRAGACDPASLAAALGARVTRQAGYYTQAARILGLIAPNPAGAPLRLTSYGYAFVRYDTAGQHRALRHLLLRTEPMRTVVQALIDHEGQSLDAVGVVLQGLAPLAPSTARRRARTVVSWLCAVGLARWHGAIVVYSGPQLATHAMQPTTLTASAPCARVSLL